MKLSSLYSLLRVLPFILKISLFLKEIKKKNYPKIRDMASSLPVCASILIQIVMSHPEWIYTRPEI